MADYHIAPDGSDSGSGSSSSPWFSLDHASSNVSAGDTIIVEDGTYEYSSAQHLRTDGWTDLPITVTAAAGATPKISFGGAEPGGWSYWDAGAVRVEGANWIIEGLEIADSPYLGLVVKSGGTNATVRDCAVYSNHLAGIRSDSATGVLVENCEVYDNYGSTSSGGDSDGIQFFDSKDATARDSKAWNNGDDGFDCWQSTDCLITNCVAHENGRDGGDGNGFKMGGQNSGGTSGNNTIERSVAWGNRNYGFNYNAATNPVQFYNTTSWNNERGYWAENCELVNNISYQDGSVGSLSNNVTNTNNTWNLGIDNPKFESTTPESDQFLRLAEGSPAIGAGNDVGLSYGGDAPDLGAYQFADSSTSPWSEVPVYHNTGGWDASEWREVDVYQHTGNGFELKPLKIRR